MPLPSYDAPRFLSAEVRVSLEGDMFRVYGMTASADVDDRTLAIVGTAFLDEMMEHVIAVRLPLFNDKLRESLFDPLKNAPLSPFSAKVDMCRAMNAIGKIPYNDLKLLARIRNEFAHKVSVDTFENDALKKHISKLQYEDQVKKLTTDRSDRMIPLKTNARGRFSYSLNQLANGLFNVGITDAGFGAASLWPDASNT